MRHPRCDCTHGLIPARAGKTEREHGRCLSVWAHPRAGGENRLSGLGASLSVGSSPRGRGKHSEVQASPLCVRLIPARAGKTYRRF